MGIFMLPVQRHTYGYVPERTADAQGQFWKYELGKLTTYWSQNVIQTYVMYHDMCCMLHFLLLETSYKHSTLEWWVIFKIVENDILMTT